MTDNTPPDEAAPAPAAAQDGRDTPKGRVNWTREQRLALWANVASFVSVGAALAAFVLLVQTLHITQNTLAVSQRAAEETQRQADIAQDALIAGNRPWVMLTDVKPVNLVSDNEFGVDFRVSISVKNVGHSPAQNVSVSGRLLIGEFDLPPDQVMASECQKPRDGSFVIPGEAVFPDQTQDLNGGVAEAFGIGAEKLWEARAARINSAREYNATVGRPDRAQAWAEELSKFPFHAPLSLVGCINYRASDNAALYQTSFMFDVGPKPDGGAFPLLSENHPVTTWPTTLPGDPDVVVVHPRMAQRVVPGDQVRLSKPLYGTFAR